MGNMVAEYTQASELGPNLLQGLNEQQLAAVTLPAQSALILAGAGSGKTRVLTTRIAWLIATGQASPWSVLAVTFTNKAAREMLARLQQMLPNLPTSMWVGTFHGLCHRMLRQHASLLQWPPTFQILDHADQQAVIKRLLKARQVDEERHPPREVQQLFNRWKEQGLRAADVGQPIDKAEAERLELYRAYEQQCRRDGLADFAELLLASYELLRDHEALRSHFQERFKILLVDEFQDTNDLQYRWLRLLAGNSPMFAVGDDDQSIYAFRGARVANMQVFERDVARGMVIRLEQNYRSYGHILNAANHLIARNRARLGKNLWTAAGLGDPIRVQGLPNEQEEARMVADEIRRQHHAGLNLSEHAILYRTNAQSRSLEQALMHAGLPYRVYGGLRFFERQEIKHALAYLRLVRQPEDDHALLRVINIPARGIGAKTVEQLQIQAQGRGVSLWSAACTASQAKLQDFVRLIERLRQDTQALPLPHLIEHVLGASGLRAMYAQDKQESEDRLENLDELVAAAAGFVREEEDSLGEFLAHAALEAGDHQAGQSEDAVQIMTVHAAKGLEFHTVFLTGLEEGLFPHDNSAYKPESLEEERRLMYVAITRARTHLWLSYSQSRFVHGQTRFALPSRFIAELPESALRWLSEPSRASTPKPAPSASVTRSVGGWKIGQSVRHNKFGLGVIVDMAGHADDARLHINFGAEGMKWLALAYAKLEAV